MGSIFDHQALSALFFFAALFQAGIIGVLMAIMRSTQEKCGEAESQVRYLRQRVGQPCEFKDLPKGCVLRHVETVKFGVIGDSPVHKCVHIILRLETNECFFVETTPSNAKSLPSKVFQVVGNTAVEEVLSALATEQYFCILLDSNVA